MSCTVANESYSTAPQGTVKQTSHKKPRNVRLISDVTTTVNSGVAVPGEAGRA